MTNKEVKDLIEDVRSTHGATLSREGCLDLFNYIEVLQERLRQLKRQNF